MQVTLASVAASAIPGQASITDACSGCAFFDAFPHNGKVVLRVEPPSFPGRIKEVVCDWGNRSPEVVVQRMIGRDSVVALNPQMHYIRGKVISYVCTDDAGSLRIAFADGHELKIDPPKPEPEVVAVNVAVTLEPVSIKAELGF